jgi:hypothetical protein
MFNIRQELTLRHGVASELVGHEYARDILQFVSHLKARFAAFASRRPWTRMSSSALS